MHHAWIYVRDSRGNTESQKEQLREYCNQKRWKIEGESGDTTHGMDYNRAGLQEAIRNNCNGNADLLVVKNLSVLGRDMQENCRIMRELNRYGAAVFSADDEMLITLSLNERLAIYIPDRLTMREIEENNITIIVHKPGEENRRVTIYIPMNSDDMEELKEGFHVDSLDMLKPDRVAVNADWPWMRSCYDYSIMEMDQYVKLCQSVPDIYRENQFRLLRAILDAEDPDNFQEAREILENLERYQLYTEDEMVADHDSLFGEIVFTPSGYAKSVLSGKLPYPAGDIKSIQAFGPTDYKRLLYRYGIYCMKEHHVACTDYGYVKSSRPFLNEGRESITTCLFQEMEGRYFWYDNDQEPIDLDGHGLVPYEYHIKKAMERLLHEYFDDSGLLDTFVDFHLRQKLISVRPSVAVYQDVLYQTLEFKSHGPLRADDIDVIKEEWLEMDKAGWAERLSDEVGFETGWLSISLNTDWDALLTGEELTARNTNMDMGCLKQGI